MTSDNGTSVRTPTRAAVLITTKDRRDDLRKALASCVEQTASPSIVVVDDGSADDTSDMVRADFPGVRLIRNETPLGIIAGRNRAAEVIRVETDADVMFTLDDDAIYTTPDTVERALAHFDHERIGAVAIPLVNFVEDRRDELDHIDWAGEPDWPVFFSFRGGANALRLDLFEHLGGYDGRGRQGEESAYGMRLLMAGRVIRAGDLPAVHHFPHPVKRDKGEILAFAARNATTFAWRFAPLSRLPLRVAGVGVNHVRAGLRDGRAMKGASGFARGLMDVPGCGRDPATPRVYRLSRRLIREIAVPWSRVEPELPAMSGPRLLAPA
ncbi:MAG: glycosyltransferase family 2 protein [Planctomycetota bacterium]